MRHFPRQRNDEPVVADSHLIKEGHMLPQLASRAATLGAGAIDPFANYPITMNKRTHELFLHRKLKIVNQIHFEISALRFVLWTY
jgi:hypothetical protein